ncbi:MAG: 30S ribosomal protein S5 [bacterium]
MAEAEKENKTINTETKKAEIVKPVLDSGKKAEVSPAAAKALVQRNSRERTGFGSPFRSNRRKIPSEYESKLLDLARVVRVSAGGKRLRFRAVVVVGNKKGKVGLGVGKGADVSQAVEKATRAAKNNVLVVAMTENSIPFDVEAKYNAARVILRPQTKGRGLVAGGTVRVVCELAGIKNVSSKILGRTTNKLNNAQATIIALKKLKLRPGQKPEEKAELKTEIKTQDATPSIKTGS